MKFHAYPKLLITIGALSVAAMLGLSAQAFDDSAANMERFTPAAALADGSQAGPATKRQKNLGSLLGIDASGRASRLAVCGDSEPDAGEECDDGNLTTGDGCSATCTVEAGFDCTLPIASQNTQNILGDPGFELNDGSWVLSGTRFSPRCTPALCGPDLANSGEAYLWLGGGQFDNGNNPGTASQTIVIPTNASTLTWNYGTSSNQLPNGTCESDTDGLEVTIDGASVFDLVIPCAEVALYTEGSIDLAALGLNDGLSHTITFNAYNTDDVGGSGILTNTFLDDVSLNVPLLDPTPPVPSSCFQAVCGDSIISDVETCDDGNAAGGDGCSATCTVEQPDFVCTDPDTNSFDILAGATGDAIREGSLEDQRGRITGEWEEDRVGPTDLLPICSEVFCPFISVNISSDGIFYALFGASSDPSDTSISQTTTIPVGATDLTFDMLVATPATGFCDSTDDFLEVTVDGFQVYLYACDVEIDGYTEQSADISAFADGLDHEIIFRGATFATNGQNTNIFVDNIQIPLDTPVVPRPSTCTALPTACDTTETFDGPGLPAGWTLVNLSEDPADGWGMTGDGTCLAQNASALADFFGDNLTGGLGGAACADSDATGQVDGGGASAKEMDTYLCSPSLDLSTITGPSYSFLTNYQSANNQFNDNGTPDDFSDDFDEDLLEVLVGTLAPSSLTLDNYTRLGGVNDHEDGNLLLTFNQELRANLEGSPLEGASSGYVCFHYKGTYAWFGQIDNATLRGDDCATPPPDSDGDGVFDSVDNCTNVANPDQRDTNGDGHGNRCDFDYTNNCVANFLDLGQFGNAFGSVTGDANFNEDIDVDGNGIINFFDFGAAPNNFAAAFGQPPGPSANECVPQ